MAEFLQAHQSVTFYRTNCSPVMYANGLRVVHAYTDSFFFGDL